MTLRSEVEAAVKEQAIALDKGMPEWFGFIDSEKTNMLAGNHAPDHCGCILAQLDAADEPNGCWTECNIHGVDGDSIAFAPYECHDTELWAYLSQSAWNNETAERNRNAE